MRLERVMLPEALPLVRRYRKDFAAVAEFYSYDPRDPNSWRQRREQVLAVPGERLRVAEILASYNRRIGSGPRTQANIERLADPLATVVVAGQQAGVCTGPLYTVYKALVAAALSRRLEEELGTPVVPLFWVAGEDHDLAEIDHLHLLGSDLTWRELRVEGLPEGQVPAGWVEVGPGVFDLIHRLTETLPPGEGRRSVLDLLEGEAAQADNLAEWFARVMARLFREQGLVMVDALDFKLRELAAPVLAGVVRERREVARAVAAADARLAVGGFAPQVVKEAGSLHLFRFWEGERLPLHWEEDRITLRGRSTGWEAGELEQRVRCFPQEFSPDVFARPLVQDHLFPVLAQVVGPGELSYHAQLREVFARFGRQLPILYLRPSLTLVEGTVEKLMRRHGLDFPAAVGDFAASTARYLEERDQVGIHAEFAAWREEAARSYRQLVERVQVAAPEVRVLAEDNLRRILEQSEWLERKAFEEHRRSCEAGLRQLRKVRENLYPRGNLQERVMNVMPFLARHGMDLLDRLGELPLLEGEGHLLVHLAEREG